MFSTTKRLHTILATLLLLALTSVSASVVDNANDSDGSFLRPKQYEDKQLSPDLTLTEEDRLVRARTLQADVAYQFDVLMTFDIGVSVLGPKLEEVEDMIRLTQIHYIRHIGSAYPQAFQMVTCDNLFQTTTTEFTITVNFLATLSFNLADDIPTREEARIQMENIDQLLYITNYVNLALPKENFVYADPNTSLNNGRLIITSINVSPTVQPSETPSLRPTSAPTDEPVGPTTSPSKSPTGTPTTSPTQVPSISPTAASEFNIASAFLGIGGAVQGVIFDNIQRLQRVIVGDLLEGVGFNGADLTPCAGGAPAIIDDIFICWQESFDIADGVLGLAVIGTKRGQAQQDRLLPLISEVVLNGNIINAGGDPDSDGRKLLVVAIEHLTLHALGIGLQWNDFLLVNNANTETCTYKANTEAGKVYQAVTNCPETETIPLEGIQTADSDTALSRCGHWSSECFNEKFLMSRNPGSSALFSTITLASLKDMGYEINDRETDDVAETDIADSCKCINGAAQTAFSDETYKIPLSEEGERTALATGLAKLAKNQVFADAAQYSATESDSNSEYVGNKRAMVLMIERGVLHGVLVEAP